VIVGAAVAALRPLAMDLVHELSDRLAGAYSPSTPISPPALVVMAAQHLAVGRPEVGPRLCWLRSTMSHGGRARWWFAFGCIQVALFSPLAGRARSLHMLRAIVHGRCGWYCG